MITFAEYLAEGGQFGHLANVWEIGSLTKTELLKFIDKSINLEFDFAELKLDSVALAFTVREDGVVVGSRNKGQTKNFGAEGLTLPKMAAKFKGHTLEFAYTQAIKDLQTAVNRLSDKQKKKIFNDGRNWMQVEVLGWGATNIIDYAGVEELTLLGTVEHDIDGNKVGGLNKDNAKMFDGMLRQKGAEQQSKFAIKNVSRATFTEINNAKKLKILLKQQLNKVMGSAKTISELKERGVRKLIAKKTKDKKLADLLIQRWVHQDKSYSITKIYKEWPDLKTWIQTEDKGIGNTIKTIMLPVEKIFLRLGAEVLAALNVFKSKDPEKSAAKLRKDFAAAVTKISASNEPKLAAKLALELKRFDAAGGAGAISPEEGVTFFIQHKGQKQLVKLTGAFAPVNQIIGLLFNL